MKKKLTGIISTMVVLSMTTASIFAVYANFVDENDMGVIYDTYDIVTMDEVLEGFDEIAEYLPVFTSNDPWNTDVNATPPPEGAMNSPMQTNDPWNADVNGGYSPEGTMNVSPTARPNTLADFADYAVDFGHGKLQGHWAEEEVALTYTNNGIKGLEVDGVLEFQPDRAITITELASLIFTNGSVDLDMDLNWQNRVIKEATQRNMLTEEMLTKTDSPILREEMAYMLMQGGKSLDLIIGESTTFDGDIPDIDEAEPEFQSYIENAYFLGLLTGTNNGYQPKSSTTRAETCVIINRLFNYKNHGDDGLMTPNELENSKPVGELTSPDIGLMTPSELDEDRPVGNLYDDVMTPNELDEDKPVGDLYGDYGVMTPDYTEEDRPVGEL